MDGMGIALEVLLTFSWQVVHQFDHVPLLFANVMTIQRDLNKAVSCCVNKN